MDGGERVLERLERITDLDRRDVEPAILFEELRLLLAEAEAWLREEGGDEGAERAVGRLRDALSRDMIGA